MIRTVKAAFAVLVLLVALLACEQSSVPAPSDPTPGIAFVSERDGNEEIYLLQPDGSGLVRLTDAPELDRDPAWSPDGRQIAFRSRRDGSSDIFLMGADGSSPTNLVRDPYESFYDEFAPRWHPEAKILALYTDRHAQACAGHRLALMPVTGGKESIKLAPVPAANQISLDWSPDGRFLVFSHSPCNSNTSYLMLWDRETGAVTQLIGNDLAPALDPAWSHNGRFIAFSSTSSGDSEIYRLEVETGEVVNLTNHPGRDLQPTWSPYSRQIAFTTDRDGNQEIYIMDADGSNPRNLTNHPARDFAADWSPIP